MVAGIVQIISRYRPTIDTPGTLGFSVFASGRILEHGGDLRDAVSAANCYP